MKQVMIKYRTSLTVAFIVDMNIMNYKSGIFVSNKENLGIDGHAVRIIGWGTEFGVDYWLVTNSWNNTWGMKGLFKIIVGDVSGID